MKHSCYKHLAVGLIMAGSASMLSAAQPAVTAAEVNDGVYLADVVPAASAPVALPADSTGTAGPGEDRKVIPDPFMDQGALGHFTWGVDIGSGVDLTAHDLTGFCMSACVGYKGQWMRFAGLGLEVMSMMNNSSRLCPIYAMARTSFSPARRQCFLEARAGISVNSIMPYKTQTDFYGALGLGLTLAHSRKFSSHVVLRGAVIPLKAVSYEGGQALNYVLAYACIGLGCAF